MNSLKTAGKRCFNTALGACVALASSGLRRELEHRNSKRGGNSLRWFTPEEAATAEALARIIIPSDEDSPGIEDIGILGPRAIAALDRMVQMHSGKQLLYARGLLSFDRWSTRVHGRTFAELSTSEQIRMFQAAEDLYRSWAMAASLLTKAWQKFKPLTQVKSGLYFAAKLFPVIRTDCVQIFYTSRVSWAWLEYDGPPMDDGYPNLLPRRSLSSASRSEFDQTR